MHRLSWLASWVVLLSACQKDLSGLEGVQAFLASPTGSDAAARVDWSTAAFNRLATTLEIIAITGPDRGRSFFQEGMVEYRKEVLQGFRQTRSEFERRWSRPSGCVVEGGAPEDRGQIVAEVLGFMPEGEDLERWTRHQERLAGAEVFRARCRDQDWRFLVGPGGGLLAFDELSHEPLPLPDRFIKMMPGSAGGPPEVPRHDVVVSCAVPGAVITLDGRSGPSPLSLQGPQGLIPWQDVSLRVTAPGHHPVVRSGSFLWRIRAGLLPPLPDEITLHVLPIPLRAE